MNALNALRITCDVVNQRAEIVYNNHCSLIYVGYSISVPHAVLQNVYVVQKYYIDSLDEIRGDIKQHASAHFKEQMRGTQQQQKYAKTLKKTMRGPEQ